ncbi:MAG: hypothetical protein V2I67_03675, partial [Thermoanaerobaculales bacterium]|nr:hypothetical protein [Thermoanaerobaculales bacterium]
MLRWGRQGDVLNIGDLLPEVAEVRQKLVCTLVAAARVLGKSFGDDLAELGRRFRTQVIQRCGLIIENRPGDRGVVLPNERGPSG